MDQNRAEKLVKCRTLDIKCEVAMKAIDRVMAAYHKAYKTTEDQTELVRAELSRFVEELLAGQRREPPKSN